jgi:NADH-quinone oxidoreductase subunit F
MNPLATIAELTHFRHRVMGEKKVLHKKPTLIMCAGTGGQASGSNDIMRIVKRYIIERNLREKISLKITGCQGFCEMDPFILVEPGQRLYPKLRIEDVPRVIESAIGDFIDEELIYKDSHSHTSYNSQDEIPFFKLQTRTILGTNQRLDPIRILDYVEQGGYAALEKVLLKHDPDWIIREIIDSGLRGRGGAGFPTGKKWELAREAKSKDGKKYIVCNADEGDPGAYMDRSLLEGNPHSIIEGMLIAGIAISASKGFIYVRSEYPLAIKHTLIAIRQAREVGLLGKNILQSGYDFDLEIMRGAGAFVCGEETALIKSIEGFSGEPRQRPPYPIDKGIYGSPTCINNVETLANISVIINKGAKEFTKVGIPGNTGTKIFSLVGKIRNTGLVEVPLGLKISQVVYDIGGGAPGNAKIKAVQTGGPSGGCIPTRLFDLSIDYESLSKAGSIMGSGGMIIMDENTCMVDVAKYFMNFLKEESCGKCFTCRKGTQRMHEILEDITAGRGTMDHLTLLEELAHTVKETSMCGLGQSAANPVLSTLRYFRNEYERHIKEKKCDAFVCTDLVAVPCQSACPVGTEAWRYVAHIARGEYKEAYSVIREANPFPSVCARVCDHPCEDKCRAGTSGGSSISIRALKRFITDRVDPSTYKPFIERKKGKTSRIAIVGAGPAGLTTAHYLSLKGYKVSIFESECEPGGMLYCAIPPYRLPRETIKNEIDSLLDDKINLKLNTTLGKDFSIEDLFNQGFKAVLLAMGSHKSKPLHIENEEAEGVYPSIEYLKAFNLRNQNFAKGKVGVIGGGNSAIDAARTAIRQKEVENVTIYYRRTRTEMPAFDEEIEAAVQEGIQIKTLVSPTRIITENGKLSCLELMQNELGELDASGRKKPVPVAGSEYCINLDTIIVAISEDSGKDCMTAAQSADILTTDYNTIKADKITLATNRSGVFAAGDVITGPNTVIEAIAAGKRAAIMIDRFIKGEDMLRETPLYKPSAFVEPLEMNYEEVEAAKRFETPRAPSEWRRRNFAEVEVSLSLEEACKEAQRCLRCDLEFTKPAVQEVDIKGVEEIEVAEESIHG